MSVTDGGFYRTPSTGPMFGVDRWKVEVPIPGGRTVAVKGISERDAWSIADLNRGRVFRSRVWVFDSGSEMLEPWLEVTR